MDRKPYNNSNNNHNHLLNNDNIKTNSETKTRHVSRVDQMLEKFSNEKNSLTVPAPQIRCKSPSPSLLRKTQAVIAKEKCNEHYMAKNIPKSPVASHKMASICNKPNRTSCPNSPAINRKEKPKNENFQKAVAFWNLP